MKKMILLLICCIDLLTAKAQVSTLDVAGMHQLIDESSTEYNSQVTARNQQAVNTANEQANLTLLGKMKNMYRTLQQRYNTLGTAITIADIGLEAEPMVNQIISNQSQIISLAEKNPGMIVLGYQSELQFAENAESLLGYVTGLVLSIGDVNQMKASDRKMLFDYVISELSKIQELSGNMLILLQYSNLNAVFKALNPFQNFVNQDKTMVNNILQNVKYLK
jgi:hypothetical protein